MISLEKIMILTPLQKLPNNVSYCGKIIVATGFECLPKKQKIPQSGHTAADVLSFFLSFIHRQVISLTRFFNFYKNLVRFKFQRNCT